MYKSMITNKDKITLSFDNVPNGFKDNSSIEGFYILDLKTEQWLPAKAKFEKDKIIVWQDNALPAQVRYAFGNTLIGNVFSNEGLPLCPFRTDNYDLDQSPVK